MVQLDQLAAHADAQRRVEIGERLVEKKNLWVAHDRPSERDALALSARQRVRFALQQLGQAERRGDIPDPLVDLASREVASPQPEGQVVEHRHVRIKRITLKHHRDIAVLGGDVVDTLAIDRQAAGADRFQPGDHPQGGRLAAARWAQQHHEFTVFNVQIDGVHCEQVRACVPFGEVLQRDGCHLLDRPGCHPLDQLLGEEQVDHHDRE